MPTSAPRICTKPGCNTLTIRGRCSIHQYDKGKYTAKDRQANRRYATNDPRWRRLRARQLHKQPLCESCNDIGLLTPARVVDHRDGDAYNNQPDNLQSMCWSCHSIKTAREDGGFGNTSRQKNDGEGGFDP